MIRSTIRTTLLAVAALALTTTFAAAQGHTSTKFSGAKVNAGTVTHSVKDGKNVLTLSSDFQVPDTPDPHWQVVDSKGNTYLLQRLGVKNLGGIAKDKVNTSITLPAYVRDVAKVQIYCGWAETVLGEASFSAPMMTMDR
jgi:parvulin-like peptidyl-prolyl isomerase